MHKVLCIISVNYPLVAVIFRIAMISKSGRRKEGKCNLGRYAIHIRIICLCLLSCLLHFVYNTQSENPLYFSPEQKYVNVGYRDRSSKRMSSPPQGSPPHKQDLSQNAGHSNKATETEQDIDLLNSHLALDPIEPTTENLRWQSHQ